MHSHFIADDHAVAKLDARGSRHYVTAAGLADAVAPPPLSPEQSATLAGLLDAAGAEVAARLARAVGLVRVGFAELARASHRGADVRKPAAAGLGGLQEEWVGG